jgi:hypothetical protein
MASEKPNRDDYFVARPLEASKHAFIVETVADAVQRQLERLIAKAEGREDEGDS